MDSQNRFIHRCTVVNSRILRGLSVAATVQWWMADN